MSFDVAAPATVSDACAETIFFKRQSEHTHTE